MAGEGEAVEVEVEEGEERLDFVSAVGMPKNTFY